VPTISCVVLLGLPEINRNVVANVDQLECVRTKIDQH